MKMMKFAIKVLSISWQENQIKEKSYEFNNITNSFEDEFTIHIKTLHSFFFGRIKIYLKSHEDEIAGCSIQLREWEENDFVEDDFLIISEKDLVNLDYYGRKCKVFGSMRIQIRKITENNEESLINEEQKGFAVTFLKNLICPKTWNILLEINDLTRLLLEGSSLCTMKSMFGFFITENFYSMESSKTDLITDGYLSLDREGSIKMRKFLDFASAAFLDALIINLTLRNRIKLNKIINTTDKIKKCILQRIDVEEDDIIKYSHGSSESCGFLVCADKNEIFIAFRGTLSASDVIHDLNGTYAPFMEGYAHAGFLALASNFYTLEWPNIIQLMKERNIKKINIAGHSLGGAIASLFHIMLHNSNLGYDIETIVFSAPPSVSKKIALHDFGKLTTIIYGKDIIPRINLGSILDFRYICLSLATKYDIKNGFSELKNDFADIRKYLKESNMNLKLYHPGSVHHSRIISKKDGLSYGIKKVDHEFFYEFRGFTEASTDHLMNGLYNSLEFFESSPQNESNCSKI